MILYYIIQTDTNNKLNNTNKILTLNVNMYKISIDKRIKTTLKKILNLKQCGKCIMYKLKSSRPRPLPQTPQLPENHIYAVLCV